MRSLHAIIAILLLLDGVLARSAQKMSPEYLTKDKEAPLSSSFGVTVDTDFFERREHQETSCTEPNIHTGGILVVVQY